MAYILSLLYLLDFCDVVRGKYYGCGSALRLRAKTQKFSDYYIVFPVQVNILNSFALQEIVLKEKS